MYVLYAYMDGEWQEYATFSDKYGYAEQVRAAVELRKNANKTEQAVNSAIVMEAFVLGGFYYENKYGKLVMRALRNFDEVGLSNDIQAALEEALDEGCERFALAKAGTNPDLLPLGEFTVRI